MANKPPLVLAAGRPQQLQAADTLRAALLSAGQLLLDAAAVLQWASDLLLQRDGAGVLSQRNGTAAQESRVYHTYTDAANGEWAAIRWNGATCEVGAGANGSGNLRNANLAFPSVGINCVPGAGPLDMVLASTQTIVCRLYNPTAGAASMAQFRATNDAGALAYQGISSSVLNLGGTVLDGGRAFWISYQVPAVYGSQSFQPIIFCLGLAEFVRFSASGHWVYATNNVYDIGDTAGAGRPRNVCAAGALVTGIKAGANTDADVTNPVDGMIRVNSTSSRLEVRVGGTWKGVTLT